MQTYTLDIRPKRQTTLPAELLEKVGVGVGDKLVATLKNNKIVLNPQKQLTLDLFAELQKLVLQSGIPEKEALKNLEEIREEIYANRG